MSHSETVQALRSILANKDATIREQASQIERLTDQLQQVNIWLNTCREEAASQATVYEIELASLRRQLARYREREAELVAQINAEEAKGQ